jgi:hypothetical protein
MWYFWLALSVAVLIIVLILHERSVKRRFDEAQAEARANRALDEKIVRMYQEIEEMLDNFEEYIGEVHGELEIRRNELLNMSRQATTLYMQVMQPGVFAPRPQFEESSAPEEPAQKTPPESQFIRKAAATEEDGRQSRLSPQERANLDRLPGKGQKIRFLTGKGYTLNDVARELGIGKGEIMLILDLDKD